MTVPLLLMKMRRAIFLLHLTTGCISSVVIFFLSATGLLLAWQQPVTAWQERAYRSTPLAVQQVLPLDRLLFIAAASALDTPKAVTIAADPRAPVAIEFDHARRLFLDRWSGRVLGPGAQRTRIFFEKVTSLHRWFGFSPREHGAAKRVKAAFDLAFLLMIVTGLILWLPNIRTWRRFRAATLWRSNLAGRARDWNLHNAVGIWFALPLAIVALTGAILAYGWMTALLYRVTLSPVAAAHDVRPKQKEKNQSSIAIDGGRAGSLESIFREVTQQFPQWKSLDMTMPQNDRTIAVRVDFLSEARPDRQVSLFFDRATGALLRQTTFAALPPGGKLRAFTKYVHTGQAGGLPGETAAGFTALSACFLVWTGLAMALRRFMTLRSADKREMVRVGTNPLVRRNCEPGQNNPDETVCPRILSIPENK
jgi:uncharacterized iron-regulated membrane protein